MAVQILEWATVKMDERYALLAEARVKNLAEFNKLDADEILRRFNPGSDEILRRFNPGSEEEEAKIPKSLPYIVIVIDELADLMMTAAKEIEAYIVRLAQKSRAVGIHIVLATQRPQATVVTGLIKSNMPDSRIILDQNGAETLLGEGDMLFLKPGTSDLIRSQGTFVDEGEIKRIVKHLKDIASPQFHPELTRLKTIDTSDMSRDELFDDAVRMVLQSKRGSVSLLQRRLNIGYARASRIIEMMAASGILGEYKGSQAREVMMTIDEYERIRSQMDADADAGYEDLAEPDESSLATDSEDDED